jgi:hypothetical protein
MVAKMEHKVGGATTFFNVFQHSLVSRASITLERKAKEAVRDLRDIILKQKYNWQPLSSEYEDYKENHELDPRTLIATGEYVQNIVAWKDEYGFWHVGPRPNHIHEPSGLPLVVLARIHEYGTSTVPARPMYRPYYARLVKDLPILQRMIIRDAKKQSHPQGVKIRIL